MPIEKPKSVTTAADKLYELVLEEKEISFKEAALRLKVPTKTVEAWATFLEEDGQLSIKYKMTTPYLLLPEVGTRKQIKKEKPEFSAKVADLEIKAEIQNTLDLIKSSQENRNKGEFGALGKLNMQLIEKLKKVVDYLTSKPELSPQEKTKLLESYSEIETRGKDSQILLNTNQFNQAHESFKALEEKTNSLAGLIKEMYSQLGEMKNLDDEGVKKLLDKTYETLSEGNLENAESNYARLKQMFSQVSQKNISENKTLQEQLIQLNRDIAVSTSKIYEKRMKVGNAKINGQVGLAQECIRKKEFDKATEYYGRMKELFKTLPPGYIKEKRNLKKNMLNVYEKIAKEKEKRLSEKFEFLAKEISALSKEISEHLSKNNLSAALTAYSKASSLFAKLPSGFLKNKFELQSQILAVYRLLYQKIETSAEAQTRIKANQILTLLKQMQDESKAGNLLAASATYTQMNSIFTTIPSGFMEEKTRLQEKLIGAYEFLLEKNDSKKEETFKSNLSTINALFDKSIESLKHHDLKQLETYYQQLKISYSRLPPMDYQQRTIIRNKILRLYKHIMLMSQQNQMPVLETPNAEDIHGKINQLKANSQAKVVLPK